MTTPGKIMVRVDDIGWTDEVLNYPIKKPDAGLRIAQQFHHAMGGLPYLAGVIPACVDHEGLTWLRTKPSGMTIALHGWDHGADRVDERDEFSARSVDEIRDRIDRGQKLIGPTEHLIPPYNAVPEVLCRAVWHEGIRYVWVGAEYGTWWRINNINVIGSDAFLCGATRWQQGIRDPIVNVSIQNVLRESSRWAVLTLHLPWEWARDPEFNGVRELVAILTDHIISPVDYFKELEEEGCIWMR